MRVSGRAASASKSLRARSRVAGKLRRLGGEKQGERHLAEEGERLVGAAAGGAHVAGTDRDHAGGEGAVAALAPAGAEEAAEHAGHVEDAAEHRPDAGEHRDDGDQRHRRDHQARADLVVLPGEDDRPRPVGEPGEADGEQKDQDDVGEDADHGCLDVPGFAEDWLTGPRAMPAFSPTDVPEGATACRASPSRRCAAREENATARSHASAEQLEDDGEANAFVPDSKGSLPRLSRMLVPNRADAPSPLVGEGVSLGELRT